MEIPEYVWEDEALRINVVSGLHNARDELVRGLPVSDLDDRGMLKRLDMDWVFTERVADDLDEARNIRDIPRDLTSTGLSEDFTERARRLQDHEPFARIVDAERAGRAGRGSRSKASVGRVDGPFELLNRNGEPARHQIFFVPTSRKPASNARRASKHTKEVEGLPICGQCFVVVKDLESHAKRCYGRCQACSSKNIACVKALDDPFTCVPCKSSAQKCSGIPRTDNGSQKECHKCLCTFKFEEYIAHHNQCVGRCSRCVEEGLSCQRRSSDPNAKCQHCTGAADSCTDFSHANPVTEELQECDRCGAMKARRHQYECRGRCSSCADATPKAICTHEQTRGKCDRCISLGHATCGDYSHAAEATGYRLKKDCEFCGVQQTDPRKHRCVGRCQPCREANNRICLRPKGWNKPCGHCPSDDVCINPSHPDRVPHEECPLCGRSIARYLLSTHKKTCYGKCSQCEGEGACVRPRTGGRGACDQCVSKGLESECDGKWREGREKSKK
jgi:hypothetical protein